MNVKYAIITPARNESNFIKGTIDSVIAQTIKPKVWIIIDDNSTDNTSELIEKASEENPWIKLIKNNTKSHREPGAKIVKLFHIGYEALDKDFDFIVKLDADLSFESDYFESIFEEFKRELKLGIAGGYCQYKDGEKLKIEKTPAYHVRGATKVYRQRCLKDIGGLIPVMGWDGLDEMKARMLGWNTRSLKNIFILHQRPTGKASGSIRFAWLWGKSSYFMGYDPFFFILRCLKNINKRPYLIFTNSMFIGYLYSVITRKKRYEDENLLKFIRNFQRGRILSIINLKTLFLKQ